MKINWPWTKPKDNYLVLLGFILLSQAAGGLGALFTISAIPTWYQYLHKPFISPPNWLFGPVWTLLYTFIGISAYLIWRKFQFGKKAAKYWNNFGIQLILNAIWTPIFFGLKWTGLAFLEIILMWYFILLTLREGRKLVPWSGYILYPYLAWVTFASLLNFSIYYLN